MSTWVRFQKLWMASPAAASSVSARENSAKTKAWRTRCFPPLLPPRPPSFSVSFRVQAHGLKRGGAAEQDAGEHRRAQGEQQDRDIQSERPLPRAA